MPRYPRRYAPTAPIHIITRFVNREFRMSGPAERALYLRCLEAALKRTDWLLLAFALMSSHVHLLALAGRAEAQRLLRSLNVAFSLRMNGMQGRTGPLVAERPATLMVPANRVGETIAYIHNNPGRAGLVADASDSEWTSHRAFIGRAPTPPWLRVDVAFALMNTPMDAAGRDAFDEHVRSRRADPRSPEPSSFERTRRELRTAVGLPIELSSPVVRPDGDLLHEILAASALAPRPPWTGPPSSLVDAVSERLGVPSAEICSRSRRAEVVRARRLVAMVGVRRLHVPATRIAAELGISSSSIAELLAPSPRRALLEPLADEIAEGFPSGDGAAPAFRARVG